MKHKKKTTLAEEDRISNLPDSTMHDILSFLDMKQVVQTSILSSKWRNLWKSAPDLSFNRSLLIQNPYASNTSNSCKAYRKDKAMDFVDRVLLLRDSSSIRTFRLSHFDHHPDFGRVVAWLIHASKLGVKHVDLEMSLSQRYVLPTLLFTSQVTVLKLDGSIQLPHGDKNEEFELSSPILRCLTLINCNVIHLNTLKISAPKLRTLVIVNKKSSVCSCVLKLCTPSLTSLKLYGALYKDYQFEKLFSLVDFLVEGFGYGPWLLHSECFMKVLSGVSSVETLEIHGCCCEVERYDYPSLISYAIGPCWKIGIQDTEHEHRTCLHEILQGPKTLSPPEDIFDLDKLLNPFVQLRCLKLVGLVGGSCTQAVSFLLKNTSSIESLVWDASPAPCGVEESWEKVLSFENKFYHLKSISAQNLKHTKVELNFLKFLLKNAIVLEKITILFPRDQYIMGQQNIKLKKEREEFMMKVQSLPKACTSARMAFIMDGKPLCVPEFV